MISPGDFVRGERNAKISENRMCRGTFKIMK